MPPCHLSSNCPLLDGPSWHFLQCPRGWIVINSGDALTFPRAPSSSFSICPVVWLMTKHPQTSALVNFDYNLEIYFIYCTLLLSSCYELWLIFYSVSCEVCTCSWLVKTETPCRPDKLSWPPSNALLLFYILNCIFYFFIDVKTKQLILYRYSNVTGIGMQVGLKYTGKNRVMESLA